MRKNVIYSIPCKRRGILQFYFKAHDKTYYLYYIRYRKKAHEFFRYGKSISELHRRKDWKKHLSNPGKHNLVGEKRLIVFPVSRNYTIKEINPAYTMLGYSTIPANRG